MRLEIERGELLKALSHVTSVVERRTTIPILSNVLLKASGSSLQFRATDLEREVSESVDAKVSQSGTLTVPAHMLHDIVRKLAEGAEIEMKRDGDKERLTLTSGHSRFSLQTLSAEDFPDLAALQQRVEALVYPEIRPILLRRAALEGNAVLTGAALLALDHLHGEEG